MNNIFQKNILSLAQINPLLAQRIREHIPTDIPKLVQENGAYNIIYKGKYIHNRVSPLGEAKEIFSQASNEPVSIHLVYGLGLGYLFQVACANSKGTVILYEPDLNILWLAFTLVDFSLDIFRSNVFIAGSMDEVSDAIYKKSGTYNNPQMLSLSSQQELNPEEFERIVTKLSETVGAYSLDLKYTREKFYPSLLMLIENMPNLIKEIPLGHFKDIYKGKTAVVVSAGPTLDRNIEALKNNRDKYVLFTVGTALKTLIANNITPDFLCIIETYNSSKQVEGIDLSDVNLITEPYSNPALRNFKYKQIYSHISANTPVNHLWADICGEDIEEYWSKGTVSYTALNCARLLGCSKIVLVGQDLAYIGGQCYSKDSAYKDLVCEFNEESNKWEITAKDFEAFANALSSDADYGVRTETARRRLAALNNSLYQVKGIQGKSVPTESVYAAFITPLSEYAAHFNDRKYINTSLVGAQIDGFENLPLEDALKDSEPVGNLELNIDFKYDTDKIKNNLENKLNELKEAIKVIEEGQGFIKNLNSELNSSKIASAESLKLLKKVSLNYLYLSDEFANKSKMYDFITIADKIDLDYEMKMMREFTAENITRISGEIARYYENAVNHINETENMIKGVLNESFDTEG